MNNRWWIYQRERFPLVANGPLVIVFCVSVMLFSSLQFDAIPSPSRIAAAAASALLFFLQLRIADEHKDFETDSRYRPHRAVPRGLVSLGELARIGWLAAAIQFLIAVSIDVGLVPILLAIWLYIGLMTREFFVPGWLQQRPAIYLLSHMLVMPMITLYISAFDWLCECRDLPVGLGWVLLLSFGCGLVLEVGRKIKDPSAEREGVETYSAVWGQTKAVAVWATSILVAVVGFSMASRYLAASADYVALAVLGLGAGLAIYAARARAFTVVEPGSGAIAMLLYLALGPMQALMV
jgi:4-hydroxybenzoate polyprenyltransferase